MSLLKKKTIEELRADVEKEKKRRAIEKERLDVYNQRKKILDEKENLIKEKREMRAERLKGKYSKAITVAKKTGKVTGTIGGTIFKVLDKATAPLPKKATPKKIIVYRTKKKGKKGKKNKPRRHKKQAPPKKRTSTRDLMFPNIRI